MGRTAWWGMAFHGLLTVSDPYVIFTLEETQMEFSEKVISFEGNLYVTHPVE